MKNKAAVALGSIKTEKKANASRENGKLGGRPKVCKTCGAKLNLNADCLSCLQEDNEQNDRFN